MNDRTLPGPWQFEPDAMEWVDESTGYLCAIRRHPRLGCLCGYVAVPDTHPMAGQSDGDVPLAAHGGITWSASTIRENETEGLWWFGFDCGHYMDWNPYWGPEDNFPDAKYRPMVYVADECEQLAAQLANIAALADEISSIEIEEPNG